MRCDASRANFNSILIITIRPELQEMHGKRNEEMYVDLFTAFNQNKYHTLICLLLLPSTKMKEQK